MADSLTMQKANNNPRFASRGFGQLLAFGAPKDDAALETRVVVLFVVDEVPVDTASQAFHDRAV